MKFVLLFIKINTSAHTQIRFKMNILQYCRLYTIIQTIVVINSFVIYLHFIDGVFHRIMFGSVLMRCRQGPNKKIIYKKNHAYVPILHRNHYFII